ncbi:MAG TPA: DUF4194 domain-containing protein [Burkholderiaceae bacterium]|jgi:hypothetical protein|nr:DUF4194 domain-containing protein [Burkholderiaceae bacterium]
MQSWPSEVAGSASAAFAGDEGQLPIDTRRVLVQLLLGPSIDARRQSRLWPVLVRDESVVRSRLHELFLELVIDRDQQVAFTRQIASEGDLDVPVLLRRAQLTFLDSVLLLMLRQRLTQADVQGERAVLSLLEMQEHLALFRRQADVDHAKFARHAENAIEKAKRLGLLRKIRGSDGRYEVSPTLKLLFSAEQIQALAGAYAKLPGRDDDEGPADDGDEPEEDESPDDEPPDDELTADDLTDGERVR